METVAGNIIPTEFKNNSLIGFHLPPTNSQSHLHLHVVCPTSDLPPGQFVMGTLGRTEFNMKYYILKRGVKKAPNMSRFIWGLALFCWLQTKSLDKHMDVYDGGRSQNHKLWSITLFSDIYQRVVNKGWISLTETISQIKTHGKLISLPPITQNYLRDLQ